MAGESPVSRAEETINRRRVLQGLGTVGAVGLAGCPSGGDGGGGDQDLGERVPEIKITYWSDVGASTQVLENSAPVIQDNLEDLGMSVDVIPMELTTQVQSMHNDQRGVEHLGFWFHTSVPNRLDPHEMVRKFGIDWAGDNGRDNSNNYANCEYTDLAVAQAAAESQEEREELVDEAWQIFNNDFGAVPLFNKLEFSVVNSDTMEPDGIGQGGLVPVSPLGYTKSSARGKDTLVGNINMSFLQTRNFITNPLNSLIAFMSRLPHSPLVEYNENYELENLLARTYEVENDATRFVVELEDATFHNGDPITAEDVQFTFQHLSNHPGVYAIAGSPPYEEISIVDDMTVQFDMEEQFLPLTTRVWPKWGILHKETWIEGGADEEPSEFQWDPPIGSGPFQVDAFSLNQNIQFSPHDGHPKYEPGHNLFFQGFQDISTATEAFINGELDFVNQITPSQVDRIQDNTDNSETVPAEGFMPYLMYPHMSYAPMMFHEVRHAVGASLDRRLMNDRSLRGDGEEQLDGLTVGPPHPWRPDDADLDFYTDDPSGDVDAARQILEDAGYGWDGSGRLHYPDGKDLTPLWPEGTIPQPEEFPCIDAEGDYVHPDQR